MTPRIQSSLPRWLSITFGLGLFAAFLALPTTSFADVPPEQVPAGLQAAIKAEVEFQGHPYAGLCKAIDQSANVGKYCATVLNLSATEAEVTYGPVASEPTAHIAFFYEDGRWSHPGGGPGEGEPTPSTVPADLTAAIKKYVESRGHQFAGICSEIAQDGSNIGKYCANVSDVTGTTASVHYGPVATNELKTVPFEKVNGIWGPRTSVGTPVTPQPPATGSGGSSSDSSISDTAVAAAMVMILAVSLGVLTARRP